MSIYRPEDFFKKIHPRRQSSGAIVFERKLGKRSARRLAISNIELERFARRIEGMHDISFSSGYFSGAPLLLNMESTSSFTTTIPKENEQTFNTATMRMGLKNIPAATACVDDGINLTFIWTLDSLITKNEIFSAHALQKMIKGSIKELKPFEDSIDISRQIPFVGSFNTASQQFVVLRHIGKTHSKSHLQNLAFTALNGSELSYYQRQSGMLLELQALFSDRWWSIGSTPETWKDWIIFFGVALAPFCSAQQLNLELRAVAESVENKKWADIKEDYEHLLDSLCSSASSGHIHYDGCNYSIDNSCWLDWAKGRLHISSQEIQDLDLYLLGGKSQISPHLKESPRPQLPIGQDDFVSESSFLLKLAG